MPDFNSAIKLLVDNTLSHIHTAIPGEVVEYSYDKGAVIRPLIKSKKPNKEYISLPLISNVPVILHSSAEFSFIVPIEKGTPVLLICAERSIDEWLLSGKESEPKIDRKFDLSDAFAIPGAFSLNKTPKPSKDGNVEFSYKGTKIVINKDGKIAIGKNGVELLDLLSNLIQALLQTTVATVMGPQPLSSAIDTSLVQLKTSLDSIKGEL